MKHLKNKLKKSLAICCAFLMIAMLGISASAYNNGKLRIYNSEGTRLGLAQMWTNNSTTDEILWAQTQTIDIGKANYVAAQALLKGMNGFQTTYLSTDIVSNTYSDYSPIAELVVAEDVVPVDARLIGAVDSWVAGLCYKYNYGQGLTPCSDGANCNFAIDLIND